MALATKIHSSYWSDEDVGRLSADQKLAVLWVLTNKETSNCGFLKASRRQFAFETGLTAEVLEGALKDLARSFVVEEKNGSLEILALNYIAYQFSDRALCGKNNIIKHLQRLIGSLPEVMRARLLDRYKDLASPFQNGAHSGSPLQAPYKDLASPQSRAEQHRAEQSTEGGVGESSPVSRSKNVVEVATREVKPDGLDGQYALEERLRYALAERVLATLNRESGATFVPTPAVLWEVARRLLEVNQDVEGVERMVRRQVELWSRDPKMRQYLRPATLFAEQKFHDYYGQRDLELPASTDFGAENPAARRAALQAKIDKSPANRGSVYHRADATEEEKTQLKKWRAELAALAG